jgi:hypothetical protein
MSKPLGYKLDILGHTWIVYYLTAKVFIKKYSDTSLAIAECDDREIYLRADKITPDTVAHEIAHAYFQEHSAPVMDLSTDQVEELACDIISKYGRRINDQADQAVHAYKVLKGRRVR